MQNGDAMDFESIFAHCSDDQLLRVTEECYLFKAGYYEDKQQLIRALRNIIYEQ